MTQTGKIWRAVAAAVAAVAMTVAVSGCNTAAQKKITIGYIAWDEDVAVTEVWKQLLEKKGYTVETKQLEAGPLFQGVSSGDLDLFMDTWLPNIHAGPWKKYKNKVDDLGVWYDKADVGIAVPDYVKKTKSLADLKKQASMYNGQITGIEPSAGEMETLNKKVVPAYGLKSGGLTVKQSSTPAMLAALEKAYKAKKPIAVALWKPHWAFAKYKIRYLDDPKKAWGKPDQLHTIASKDFSKDNADAAKWIKKFNMNPTQLAELEKQIQDAGGNEKAPQAVKAWLKDNKSLTKKWVPADK